MIQITIEVLIVIALEIPLVLGEKSWANRLVLISIPEKGTRFLKPRSENSVMSTLSTFIDVYLNVSCIPGISKISITDRKLEPVGKTH